MQKYTFLYLIIKNLIKFEILNLSKDKKILQPNIFVKNLVQSIRLLKWIKRQPASLLYIDSENLEFNEIFKLVISPSSYFDYQFILNYNLKKKEKKKFFLNKKKLLYCSSIFYFIKFSNKYKKNLISSFSNTLSTGPSLLNSFSLSANSIENYHFYNLINTIFKTIFIVITFKSFISNKKVIKNKRIKKNLFFII
jgi:hypothetical protein